ncbi:MAG: M1 family aminopeptidase/hydrolase [Terriglobia bacterium]
MQSSACFLLYGGLAACHSNSQENLPATHQALVQNDPHSYANASEAKIQHLDLDLKVDFEKKILEGTAILQLQNSSPGTTRLICDTSQLSIESVETSSREGAYQQAKHQLGKSDPILGAPLTITLPPQTFRVRIRYATSPHASALQWMDPAQTAGRKYPFLFSQSQPVHCRSWIPLQDSPQVRLTYLARIHIPKGLRAVMSASELTHTDEEFSFEMKQPIPSYLIAIAVGPLGFKALGPRTGVYAEPEILDQAAKEFSDAGKTLDIAEKTFGDYRWGRYDLLILPPSFPYGGMENATLTFLSPTVIAGDGSLLNIVAHELSHSWAGNLVTNESWNDLWLNEGITTYLENRLMEALYGKERADMELAVQKQSLLKTMAGQSTKETVLHLNLDAQNPEEAANDVAYVKGALFMRYLEETFGHETFDQFLRRYFDQFAFQSMNSGKFEAYLKSELLPRLPASSSHSKEEIMASIHGWLYTPGLPQSSSPPIPGDWRLSPRRHSSGQASN